MAMTEATTRQLLVRSAGICALCKDRLLTSRFTGKDIYLGERAHNVGRGTGPNSPRGKSAMDLEERDEPDNLLLLCPTCHGEIDEKQNLDAFTVDRLKGIKTSHERWVSEALAIPPDRSTWVLRMQGNVGRDVPSISRSETAIATLDRQRTGRFAGFTSNGVEIDLRPQPDPVAAYRPYYDGCRRQIDATIGRELLPAIESGTIDHLSVFAIARWPLLTYLGSCLGDKVPTDVYQRHRIPEGWTWPTDATGSDFSFEFFDGAGDDTVVVLSMSASVQRSELPADLQDHPTYTVSPTDRVTPHADIVATPAALKAAERCLRSIFSEIEATRKTTPRIHVVGAAPLSVCLTLGRIHLSKVHPPLSLYDRNGSTYELALEIN